MRRLKFIAFLIISMFVGAVSLTPAAPAVAACEALANDKGQAALTLNVETPGQYTVWLRMLGTAGDRDSIFVQVDDQCPVNAGDSQSSDAFRWVNFTNGDPNVPMRFELAAGGHTIKLAGRDAGAGVDKVLLVNDQTCTPVDMGENCNVKAETTAPTVEHHDQVAAGPNWLVIGASIAVILGALGFLVWKYRRFLKTMALHHAHENIVVGSALHPNAPLVTKLAHFFKHHKISVLICAVIIIAASIVGAVTATGEQPSAEVESAALSGATKTVDDAKASGGKYVTFEQNPVSKTGSAPIAGAPATGGGKQGGGTSGGGTSGGSSGGSTTTCPLPAYPSASCTGVPAGTSLTEVKGDMTISTANTVIEGKDIKGCVTVNASGVIIRKSKITGDCFYVVYHKSSGGTALLIEDSEISCGNNNGTAIGDTGITVKRSNITGCENGFDVDGDVTIQDSFIHDLYDSDVAHTDGIQLTDVAHNVTISHNTIYSNYGTSSIISPPIDKGIATNILIQNNLMAGGAYTLYCEQGGPGVNYRVLNNHFSNKFNQKSGAYGAWTDCEDEAQVSGNVYHESGAAVQF